MAVRRFSQALTPAVVATVSQAEQSFVINAANDLNTGAFAAVTKPTTQSGGTPTSARVIDATHIGIVWTNPTAAGVTPTAGEIYQFLVID